MANQEAPKYEDTVVAPSYEDTLPMEPPQQQATEPQPSGVGEALARGAVSGATFGFGDRLEAAGRSATGPGKYDDLLASIRERNRKVAAEHPYADTLGKIGGGVGSILLGGGLLGAGAEAAGLGEAAGTAASALGLGGEATLGSAIRGGATLGAATGVGESEDLTKAGDVAKNAVQGAAGGALGGAVLHGAAAPLAKVGNVIENLPVIEEGLHAVKKAFKGETLEAPETRKALSEGVEDVINKVQDIQKHISENYNKVYESELTISPDEIATLGAKAREGTLTDAEKIVLKNLKFGENELEPIQARTIDNEIKALKDTADSAYSPVYKTGDVATHKQALQTAEQLKSFLKDHLSEEAKAMLSLADKQNFLASNMRAKLNNLPSGLRKGLGDQDAQAAYDQAVKGLSDDFIAASKGNAEDTNRLNDAFDYMSKLEDSSASLNNPIPKESGELFKELGGMAKDYRIAELGQKRSEFGGLSKGGYSLKGLPVHAGQAIGTTGKAVVDTASIPMAATRDLVGWVSSQSPEAATLVNSMKNSADETAQKAGKILNDVLIEPNVSKRRALMFSLSQQPWFRDVAAKHLGMGGSGGPQETGR